MEDGSIEWRAMERTSQKAYQRREKLLDWRENRFQKNEQQKKLVLSLRSSGSE